MFDTVLPGYIANRLQAAMSLEIYHLMDEGLVTADMVDDSIKYGLALRMATLGHLKKADFTGIDMIRRAMANGTRRRRSRAPPARRSRSWSTRAGSA